jgi:outer membrane lipopolysaccharide assembly protein LptE/RlpB
VKAYRLAALIMVIALVSSCGYSFRGKQNSLPSDIRTVAIPVFENTSGTERIESTFTDEVIFQFTKSQMVRIVSRGQADAILWGRVVRVDTDDIALSSDETSNQQRIKITLNAKLVRRSTDEVIWQNKKMVQRRTFSVGSDSVATDANRTEAIRELAEDMAQTLHDSVFENF